MSAEPRSHRVAYPQLEQTIVFSKLSALQTVYVLKHRMDMFGCNTWVGGYKVTKLATTSWVSVIFDTDGEVMFAMASTLTHQDFQASTKHEPRVFPTSPSVSKATKSQDVVTRFGGQTSHYSPPTPSSWHARAGRDTSTPATGLIRTISPRRARPTRGETRCAR